MIIDKPWGHEEIIFRHPNHYMLKKICLLEGRQTSLHYHNYKHETLYLISGNLSVEIDGKYGNIYPGQTIVLPPGEKYVHRMTAISTSIYIEASTDHLDDVVRIQDQYGRI